MFLEFFFFFLIYFSSWCKHNFQKNETMTNLCYCILSLGFSVLSLHVSKVDLISCESLWSRSGWNSHRYFFLPKYHITIRELDTPFLVLTSLCSFGLICPLLYPMSPRANEPFSSIKQGELVWTSIKHRPLAGSICSVAECLQFKILRCLDCPDTSWLSS